MLDLEHEEMRWFDQWLKNENTGILEEPPLRLFIMGINEWRDEHEWPLARTDWQAWHLHSDGRAQSVRGDGRLTLAAPADVDRASARARVVLFIISSRIVEPLARPSWITGTLPAPATRKS